MNLVFIKRSIHTCSILIGAVFCLLGQTEIKFDRIVSKEGDFQSIVYQVEQDSLGYIWTATEEGVVRYNGTETTVYNRYRGLPQNITNRITALFIDSQYRIWIGNQEGLSLYIPEKDEFEYIEPPGGKGPNLIKVITEDADGGVLIGGFNGLWNYKEKESKGENNFSQIADDYNVKSLLVDGDQLLMGSNKGLHSYNFEKQVIQSFSLFEEGEIPMVTCIYKSKGHYLLGTQNHGLLKTDVDFNVGKSIELASFSDRNYMINKIIPDQKENFFVATDGAGLLHLDDEYQLLNTFENDVNRPQSISSNGIYDIHFDEEKLLWIATYGGGLNLLNLYNNNFQNIAHRLNTPNSIAHNFTRAILEDDKGNIWFGTKKGVSIWNRKTNQWKNLASFGGKNNDDVIVLALEEDGDYVWAGTYGRGAFKINKNTFESLHYSDGPDSDQYIDLTKIYSILKDDNGNCWLGGIDKSLHRIAASGAIHTFPISQIRQLTQSRDGGIWVVGKSGLQKIKGDEIIEFDQFKSLDYSTINCVYENENGQLTIGTNGAGLLFFDPQNSTVKAFTQVDGLPSDIVQGFIYDDAQNLWVSTTRGLVNLTFLSQDTNVKLFNKADGLACTEYNYGSYTKTTKGELFFGGIDGVTFFSPNKITQQKNVPKVVFEEFELFVESDKENRNFKNINFSDEVKLDYKENSLRIKFIGILHSAPGKVQYSWQMNGVTDEWSKPGAENNINFSNLSPGKYTFKVKAANRDGVWSEERQLKINIASPWWASNLAYFIYALLGIAALIGIVYLTRVFGNKRNADEQIAFFSNITHELKTPLSILLSTLEAVPEGEGNAKETNKKVKSTITRLNTLFDQLLNFNKVTSGRFQKNTIAKIDLRSHVEHIIRSFKPLMEKRNITVQTEDSWTKEVFYYDKEVLNKVLFNLLSNAIKYSKDNGGITVSLAPAKNNYLKLAVKDNGIGIPKDQQKQILKRYYRGRNAINSQLPGTGLGLMIVKNLVERDNGFIDFISEENEGTTFTILLKDQEKDYVHHAVLDTPKAKDEFSFDSAKINAFSDAKILVVEDNNELREMMVERISTYFQVLEAKNGKEGLEVVREHFPDLIITDLIMPEMDGMIMSQQLQEDMTTNHIPIFMMTVLNSTQNKIESIESGILAYMEKPIDFNFLLAKIVSTLSRQKKLSVKYQHQVEIENAEKFRNKRDAEFINTLEKFVLEEIQKDGLSVHDLCRHVGMSRTALYMKLKNMIDMSPQNFIIHTRLKYARKMLLENQNNIKEVAFMAGFANPKYFSTSFKKQFGQSPTDFMKSLSQ